MWRMYFCVSFRLQHRRAEEHIKSGKIVATVVIVIIIIVLSRSTIREHHSLFLLLCSSMSSYHRIHAYVVIADDFLCHWDILCLSRYNCYVCCCCGCFFYHFFLCPDTTFFIVNAANINWYKDNTEKLYIMLNIKYTHRHYRITATVCYGYIYVRGIWPEKKIRKREKKSSISVIYKCRSTTFIHASGNCMVRSVRSSCFFIFGFFATFFSEKWNLE